jgi:hypothetical protein
MGIRLLVAATAVALLPWSAGAQVGAADLDDFQLQSAQDLVDLCSAQPGNPLYAEARQFCYGFFSGVYFFHDALATGTDLGRIVCPEEQVTRDDAVDMFITWASNHPEELASDQPAEALIRAAVDKWGRCQE